MTNQLTYNSQRIYHPTEDIFCGLEFEVIRDRYTCSGYLNIFSGTLAEAPVTLKVDGQTYAFQTIPLAGGQRFLIPRAYTLFIIASLLNNKYCIIELPYGYAATLTPSNFNDAWHSKPPLVPYPKIF